MRVISGSAKGMKLTTLEGETIRPTADRVKEAVFSSIQFDISGSFVLDLFCGSGGLGIEALSRGARACTFVDQSKASIATTKENVQKCGFEKEASFENKAFDVFLKGAKEQFDIVLMDPPYKDGLLLKAISLLLSCGILSECAIIICESEKDESLPDKFEDINLLKTYVYGKTKIWKYKREGGI